MAKCTLGIQTTAIQPVPTVPRVHPSTLTVTKIAFITLLASERRGEEVNAVGAAPECLLLRRQRLPCGSRRHLHGRSGDGGELRDPRPLPPLARRPRRGGDRALSAAAGGRRLDPREEEEEARLGLAKATGGRDGLGSFRLVWTG